MIAAQSIGEPGTQLTMRTFHIGGTAQVVDSSFIESNVDGSVKIRNRNVQRDSEGNLIAMVRNMSIVVVDSDGNERAVSPDHLRLQAARGMTAIPSSADSGSRNGIPIPVRCLPKSTAVVDFEDLIDGASVQETADEATGITKRVVIDWRSSQRSQDLKPAIVIKNDKGEIEKTMRGSDARLMLSVDAILSVQLGAKVKGR